MQEVMQDSFRFICDIFGFDNTSDLARFLWVLSCFILYIGYIRALILALNGGTCDE